MIYVQHTDNLYAAMPDVWKRTLASVQGYFPEAEIAGGALRDLWHDKTAKDVDIFIPVSDSRAGDDDFKETVEEALLKIDPYLELVKASIYGQSGNVATPGFRNIYLIYRLNIEGVIFECIFIEDRGEDMIEVFDLSIAQIGYDGSQIRYTANFFRTVSDKVIRVCNVNRSDRQTKRMERVLAKYPEYRAETDIDIELDRVL